MKFSINGLLTALLGANLLAAAPPPAPHALNPRALAGEGTTKRQEGVDGILTIPDDFLDNTSETVKRISGASDISKLEVTKRQGDIVGGVFEGVSDFLDYMRDFVKRTNSASEKVGKRQDDVVAGVFVGVEDFLNDMSDSVKRNSVVLPGNCPVPRDPVR